MDLLSASRIAALVVEDLRIYCDRIEIAGSIRRGKPEVNDIDLVGLAKDDAGFRRRCRTGRGVVVQLDGELNFIFTLRTGVQVDVFFAHPASPDLFGERPSNWGTLLLCRTGSKEHNIKLALRAKDLGLHWNPYEGVKDSTGKILASETEADIFAALEMDYIEPARREA